MKDKEKKCIHSLSYTFRIHSVKPKTFKSESWNEEDIIQWAYTHERSKRPCVFFFSCFVFIVRNAIMKTKTIRAIVVIVSAHCSSTHTLYLQCLTVSVFCLFLSLSLSKSLSVFCLSLLYILENQKQNTSLSKMMNRKTMHCFMFIIFFFFFFWFNTNN